MLVFVRRGICPTLISAYDDRGSLIAVYYSKAPRARNCLLIILVYT